MDFVTQVKDFKFVATLVLVFKKIENEDKTKYDTFYSNSKAEIIINDSDIKDVTSNIHKSLGKGSGWIIDSVIDHNISNSKYNPLAGTSYIRFRPSKKSIN